MYACTWLMSKQLVQTVPFMYVLYAVPNNNNNTNNTQKHDCGRMHRVSRMSGLCCN